MPLTYRPAQKKDLAITDALVVGSINDLTERHGFGPMAAASAPNFQLFSLEDDPDGLWVAEDAGDAAFGCMIIFCKCVAPSKHTRREPSR